jgi:predicted HTH transcriptional regulator
MIPELLREIIAKSESPNVEFKGEEKVAMPDSALVEAVICLANRSGVEPGWLLVGMEDDGRITGSKAAPLWRKNRHISCFSSHCKSHQTISGLSCRDR